VITRRLPLAAAFALLFMLPLDAATAEPDPEVARLGQRLQSIETDPQRNAFAAYERLQARQALQALESAKRKQRPQALQVAKIRIETAEIASRTEFCWSKPAAAMPSAPGPSPSGCGWRPRSRPRKPRGCAKPSKRRRVIVKRRRVCSIPSPVTKRKSSVWRASARPNWPAVRRN
jgi:hypothetical protein